MDHPSLHYSQEAMRTKSETSQGYVVVAVHAYC
jgi:hypothetical protein